MENTTERPCDTANIGFHMIGGKQWYGGRNYLLNLVRTIQRYTNGNLQCKIFVDKHLPTESLREFNQESGCTIVPSAAISISPFEQLAAIASGSTRRIEDEFARHDIDVAFENSRFYGRTFKIPTLSWLPDFQHRHLPNQFTYWQYMRREIGFRCQTNGSREVLVSSQDAKADCEHFYPRSRGRVHVVTFAVPYSGEISPSKLDEVKAKHKLPTQFFYLPNQFYTHKNHILVAKALRILRDRNTPVFVVATGNPSDARGSDVTRKLLSFLRKYRLEEYFRIIGTVPYKDVRMIMNCSSALLNPSLFEGWSTTVEEAKADGIPMILSDLNVHREQAVDAIYFERANADSLAEALSRHTSSYLPRKHPDELAVLAEQRLMEFANAFQRVIATCRNCRQGEHQLTSGR